MKRIIVLILSLIAFNAFSIDTFPIGNPQTNGATKFFYNDAGTPKEVLRIDSNGLSGGGFSAKNYLLNAKFDFWQRATSSSPSFTSATSAWLYSADQWRFYGQATTGSATVTRNATTPGAVSGITDSEYYLRWQQTVAPTGGVSLNQPIESAKTLSGKVVTISAWMTGDSHPLMVYFTQNFGSGGSASVDKTCSLGTITSGYNKYSCSVTLDSVYGKTFGTNHYLGVSFVSQSASTFDFNFYGVMLNEGSVAAPFRLSANSFEGELLENKRFYSKSCPVNGGINGASGLCSDGIFSFQLGFNKAINTYNFIPVSLPVEMRIAPVVTTYDGNNASNKITIFTSGSGASSHGQDYYQKTSTQTAFQVINYTLAYYGYYFYWTADAAFTN